MADYVRQMPDHGSADLARRPGLASRLHIDVPLLLLLLALTAYGLFVLYSGSGKSLDAVIRQGTYFLVAYVVMFTVAQISLHRLMRWAPWFYLLAVALLVAVMVVGVGAKGAQRWLSIGGFRFQPSEIMKLVVPMAVAWYLADRALPPRVSNVGALALVLVPAALILHQPDLGTALLIAVSGLFVLFMAGMGWRYILGAAVLAMAASWPMWMFVLKDYQKQRILTLLDPESRQAGGRLEHYPVEDCDRFRGLGGQGLDQGNPVSPGFPAGEPHGFHHRRVGRGVRPARGAGVDDYLPVDPVARILDRNQCPVQFRADDGRQPDPDVFRLHLC